MPREDLNSRERWALLTYDDLPDRVPITPFITVHAAKVLGIDARTYCTNGQALGRSQLAAYERYGTDGIFVYSDMVAFAEAMGSTVSFTSEGIPHLDVPCIVRRGNIGRAKKIDKGNLGRIAGWLEAVGLCYDAVGGEVPINFIVMAPFTLAALLRGTEAFLFDLMEDPGFARELMEFAKESMLELIDLAVLEGAVPSVADPLASTSVISPAMYREFAFPYEKELVEYIRNIGFDAMLHICGETEPILKDVVGTGADLFSFDRVPVNTVVEKVGRSMRLIGNIDPVQLMFSSPEEIERDVRECIEAGRKSSRGFILATGCEVALDTPQKNIEALMKAGAKYGQLWDPADNTLDPL